MCNDRTMKSMKSHKGFLGNKSLKGRTVTDRKASEWLSEFCRDSSLFEVWKNHALKPEDSDDALRFQIRYAAINDSHKVVSATRLGSVHIYKHIGGEKYKYQSMCNS